MKPIVTEEDKKLVGYLKKKNKKPKVSKSPHVFYNKKKKDGSSSYLMGKYYSNKNKKMLTYRSSYELRFFQLLDENPLVVSYESETIKIPYIDLEGKKKNYIPDVVILYRNGSVEICEVKPKAMLNNLIVKKKAAACRNYFRRLLGNSDISYRYRFITEEDLFSDASHYNDFLRLNANR